MFVLQSDINVPIVFNSSSSYKVYCFGEITNNIKYNKMVGFSKHFYLANKGTNFPFLKPNPNPNTIVEISVEPTAQN